MYIPEDVLIKLKKKADAESMAKEAIVHAGSYAFRDRRTKKREFRYLCTIRLNAALRENNLPPYSKFIDVLKKKNVSLDRKSLAALAKDHPEAFLRFAKSVV